MKKLVVAILITFLMLFSSCEDQSELKTEISNQKMEINRLKKENEKLRSIIEKHRIEIPETAKENSEEDDQKIGSITLKVLGIKQLDSAAWVYYEVKNNSDEFISYIGFTLDIYGNNEKWLGHAFSNHQNVQANSSFSNEFAMSNTDANSVKSYKIRLDDVTIMREGGKKDRGVEKNFDFKVVKQ